MVQERSAVRGVLALVAVAVLVSACSSTNAPNAASAAPGRSAPPNGSAAPLESLAPVRSAAPGSTTKASERPSKDDGDDEVPTLPPTVAVSDKVIKIGFNHLAGNFDQINATFGAKNNDPGDPLGQAQAVVKYINAHGGMAGRKVEAIYHGTDVTVGTFDSQTQATCAAFTEDEHVFAAISETNGNRSLERCLAKKKVPAIVSTLTTSDAKDFAMLGQYLYEPNMVSGSRLGAMIPLLAANGYFTPGAVLGIMRYSDETNDRISNNVIKPALAKRGLKVTEEIEVTPIQGAGDLGAQASAVAAAILRLRSSGVTHVIFIPTGGQLPFFFQPAAESQGYRPRYAYTSLDAVQTIFGSAPHAQYVGSVGMGWLSTDVAGPQNHFSSSLKTLCKSIMKKAGGDPTKGSGTCSDLFFLKHALDKAPSITAAGLQTGAESIGTSFVSASLWATRFGPKRHDGAAQARALIYKQACDCLEFTGPLREIK